MPKYKYLVQYCTPQFNSLLIAIWARDKTEARKMLRKHLGSTLFNIKSITKEDGEMEDDENE